MHPESVRARVATPFRLDPKLKRALKVRAAQEDVSMRVLVERALTEYLRRNPAPNA